MIYNNLIFFLVAIFLFTTTSGSEALFLPFTGALLSFSVILFIFDRISVLLYSRVGQNGSGAYFKAEKHLSILALLFYAVILFCCDIHYYLMPLSLGERFPSFVTFGGLAFFFIFLLLMWRRAKPAYESIFGRSYTTPAFLLSNVKANLPIVFPWMFLSLAYDLLALLPFPEVKDFLHSELGEYASFILFLFLILIFFPPIVRRLWGCTPFPEGALLDHLQDFFKKQNFSAKVFSWPLFEGRVITAGVMGIIPGLRYVIITPALLENLTQEELDAVMAHEIAHIKKKHMLLYLFIISGFSVLAGFILEPFTFFILSRSSFYALLGVTGITAENMLTIIMAFIVLIAMVLYFRFLFGYFIRNFERQADLYVFKAIGNSDSIISAFEKIAVLSGNIRDLPSWHHFGIGERVDYLEKCEQDRSWIKRHNRKVWLSLFAYVVVLLLAASGKGLMPTEIWKQGYEEKYTEFMIDQKLMREPDKALWLGIAGDLLQHKKMEKKAIAAYEKALVLEPSNPKLLNNLAWLLLTSDNRSIRDPGKALDMASSAARQVPVGHVLDTLATAYWANSFVEKAIETEEKAIRIDPAGSQYYRGQILKFSSREYE